MFPPLIPPPIYLSNLSLCCSHSVAPRSLLAGFQNQKPSPPRQTSVGRRRFGTKSISRSARKEDAPVYTTEIHLLRCRKVTSTSHPLWAPPPPLTSQNLSSFSNCPDSSFVGLSPMMSPMSATPPCPCGDWGDKNYLKLVSAFMCASKEVNAGCLIIKYNYK